MEIELPDGTVLEAPDGADVKAVVRGYNRSKLKTTNPSEYDPKSGAFQAKYGPVQAPEDSERSSQTFREGIGSGMVRMNRGLGNVANKVFNKHPIVEMMGGIDFPGKEFYGDEAIRSQDKLDSPLAKTTKGSLGQGVGQAAVGMAATAPLGAIGAASRGGSMLARTLASPTTRAALEGAVTGAGASDPDAQGRGAMTGALASAAVERFLAGGGRAVKGLVKKSEAVQDLEHLAGQNLDIPISQAASDEDIISRAGRAIYQEGLPNVIGVKGQLARQSKESQRMVDQLTPGGGLAEALKEEIFSEPVTRGTRTGKLLTTLGLGGIGVYGSPVLPVVTILGGNVMATRTAQRALMGETAAQRKIADVVAKNPNLASTMRRFLQQVGASESGADDVGHD